MPACRTEATIEILLDEIGDDESHPLADVLDYLADRVAAYEEEHAPIPGAEPKEVLRILMNQHGLNQADLDDCAPQGRISDILNGRRGISKEIARRLARRFDVSAALFLGWTRSTARTVRRSNDRAPRPAPAFCPMESGIVG